MHFFSIYNEDKVQINDFAPYRYPGFGATKLKKTILCFFFLSISLSLSLSLSLTYGFEEL